MQRLLHCVDGLHFYYINFLSFSCIWEKQGTFTKFYLNKRDNSHIKLYTTVTTQGATVQVFILHQLNVDIMVWCTHSYDEYTWLSNGKRICEIVTILIHTPHE